MSHVAADFHTQASNASLSKANRQGHGAPKAPSGQFDDLLNAIPDAPPEPRERPAAAERAQPAEARPAPRSERPQRAEGPAKPDSRPDDHKAAVTDEPSPAETAPAKAETATETQPVDAKTPAEAGETETKTADAETADTSAATQAAVTALVPQAAVIDPAAAVTVADPSLEGETPSATTSAQKTDPALAAAASKAAQTTEQQAMLVADQTTGLSAEDAEVLSALAVKVQQGTKEAQGDKPATKTEGDKPAQTAKLSGDAAAPAAAAAQTPASSAEADTSGAKPVQSELAKVGAEQQHGKSDTNGKHGVEQAATAAPVNTAAVRTPDTFAAHLMSPTLHTAHAANAAPAASPTSIGDKAVPVSDVGIEITAKIASGKNQFDIRLDPAELGRIHVKVSVDREGNISTHMMADRPETLDLLRRDTQGLERALQDAGLKTSDNGMQFSLRDQTQQQQQQQNQNDSQVGRLPAEEEATTTLTTTVIARDYGRYGARPSGLDIRV